MAKQMTKEEREALLDDEICEGMTYREALACLPKIDLETIMKMDSKDIVEKMQNYVIARLHIDYVAGVKEVIGPISKLHLERHISRAKVTAVMQVTRDRKQNAGFQVEANTSDMGDMLGRLLSGNVHLPEGDAETGMKNLREVHVG